MSRIKRVLALLSAAAMVLVGGAAASATAPPADPWEGFECESVFTGGGWISFCTAIVPASTLESVERVAGADRYATSALLSARTFEPGVPVVYIANGVTLVDALGAGAASGGDGPVLVVPATGTLPQLVGLELERLDPARVVFVGSEASVSEAMADQVVAAAER